MEYYSAIRKNEIMLSAATLVDLGSVRLSEGSQRRRNMVWHPLYVEKKKIQMNLQNRNRLSDLENELRVARGKDRGRDS